MRFTGSFEDNAFRGSKPKIIASSNGKKIVRAVKEFAGYVNWDREEITKHLFQRGIRCKINTPAAPNFGQMIYMQCCEIDHSKSMFFQVR